MNKITRDAAEAFIQCASGNAKSGFNRGNTVVFRCDAAICKKVNRLWSVDMSLHGNTIARWCAESDGTVNFMTTLAGYGTPTTRARLNGLIETMAVRGFIVAPRFYKQIQYSQYLGYLIVGKSDWKTPAQYVNQDPFRQDPFRAGAEEMPSLSFVSAVELLI